MIHTIAYTLYTPTAGGQHPMTAEIEANTRPQAIQILVEQLETELEAGDLYNYSVQGIFQKYWGWEPGEDETICI